MTLVSTQENQFPSTTIPKQQEPNRGSDRKRDQKQVAVWCGRVRYQSTWLPETSLRWRIKLWKQRGLCEMSEIAETHSTVYVKVLRLFIYLIVWKHGSRGRRIAKDRA